MFPACACLLNLSLSLKLRGLWVANNSGSTVRVPDFRVVVHPHLFSARISGAFMQNERAGARVVGLNDVTVGSADHAAPVSFARFRVSVNVIGSALFSAYGLTHLLRLDDGPLDFALKAVSLGALVGIWLCFQLFAGLMQPGLVVLKQGFIALGGFWYLGQLATGLESQQAHGFGVMLVRLLMQFFAFVLLLLAARVCHDYSSIASRSLRVP